MDFASNDYLGLSKHPRIRERMIEFLRDGPAGSPASRLLRGNHPSHEKVEQRFAHFKGAEAALFFSTGYQANIGLLQALVRPDDMALSDALNHASIIDGLRLAGPRRQIYPHLDLDTLDTLLGESPAQGNRFIVTESLFSMDGDGAPLAALGAIAQRHGALLVVDDAHATGILGDRGVGLVGSGAVEQGIVAAVSTCGKAIGLSGAFVTGPRQVIDSVINHARSFIYSTSPPPVLAEAICEALDILEEEPWRRQRVLAGARRLREGLHARGVLTAAVDGPIVPVLIGDNAAAVAIAAEVREHGYDVRALRPPSVPPGTARLRISVHADHSDADIDGVGEFVAVAMERAHAGTGR